MEPLKGLVLPLLHPGKIWMPSKIIRVPRQWSDSLHFITISGLYFKRIHKVILKLRFYIFTKLATWIDSKSSRQGCYKNFHKGIPIWWCHYPLLLVLFIKARILSCKRLPMSLILGVAVVVRIRRGTIRFVAFPDILSAIMKMLSLSSWPVIKELLEIK